jgi:hypothetical protein
MNRRRFLGLGTFLLFSGCLGDSAGSPDTANSSGEPSTEAATSTPAKTGKSTSSTPVTSSLDTPEETESPSGCMTEIPTEIPTEPGGTVVASDPPAPDFAIQNNSNKQQTVQITVTSLPIPSERTTSLPEGVHKSEKSVVFQETTKLRVDESQVYRCTVSAAIYKYQVKVEVSNGLTKVFESDADDFILDIGINSSSIVRL